MTPFLEVSCFLCSVLWVHPVIAWFDRLLHFQFQAESALISSGVIQYWRSPWTECLGNSGVSWGLARRNVPWDVMGGCLCFRATREKSSGYWWRSRDIGWTAGAIYYTISKCRKSARRGAFWRRSKFIQNCIHLPPEDARPWTISERESGMKSPVLPSSHQESDSFRKRKKGKKGIRIEVAYNESTRLWSSHCTRENCHQYMGEG